MKRGDKLRKVLDSNPTENGLSDAGLRYDLTVPLARVAAEYQHLLPRVFKRFQIQPVYRADRPAKGRFREFFQCDLDIVGSGSLVVESEILNAAAQVMQVLGFAAPADFTIRLNHRSILKGILSCAGVDSRLEESTLIALDKLDKAGLDGVCKELEERQIPSQASTALIEFLETVPSDNRAILDTLTARLQGSEIALQGVLDLKELLSHVQSGPAGQHVRIDPCLARGLSYYTGSIFEIDFGEAGGSGGGGGRYDELIGMFLGRRVPACGISLGLERIILTMEERGLFPNRLEGQPQVLVSQFSGATVDDSLKLAHQLRQGGLRVDVYPEAGKYGRQFKYADQRGIRYVALLSPHEIDSGVVSVKDLHTRAQQEIAPDEVVSWFRSRLEEE